LPISAFMSHLGLGFTTGLAVFQLAALFSNSSPSSSPGSPTTGRRIRRPVPGGRVPCKWPADPYEHLPAN
jgi:hypothetical protein